MKKTPKAYGPLCVVLVIDYSLAYVGGAQTAFMRQAVALASQGWRVTVAAPDATRADWPAGAERVAKLDIPVRWRVPGVDLPMLGSRAALARRMGELFDSVAPDAVMVHSEFALASAAITEARDRDVVTMQTVHTFFWTAPKTLGAIAPVIDAWHRGVTGFRPVRGFRPSSRINNTLRAMTLRVGREVDVVCSPSKHQAEALRRAGLPCVEVVSNVVESLSDGAAERVRAREEQRAAETLEERSSEPLRLLWAARFAPEKRVEVALQAVRIARERGVDVELEVAGGRAEAQPGVTFHGLLTPEQVGERMYSADAVLITSYGFDNQPMIALEAFKRGVPVVVSDPIIAREFGAAAIGAKRGDAVALADTLVKLAREREKLRTASEAAMRYAAEREPEKIAKRLSNVIYSLMA